jgi:hypothetical protein
MLAVGIALGALIGPGPASSLANGTRTTAIARVLGLLALADGASTSSQTLLAGGTTHTAHGDQASSAGATSSRASARPQASSGGGHSETSPTSSTQPSSSALSPTKKTGASAPAGSEEPKPARLAPVAHVWLIELPYGESFTNILGQSTAAPYTTGELVKQGTLLSSYSALQTSELAGDATLLSGQVAAAVSTIVAPCPAAPATPGTTTSAPTSSPSATSPCAVSEPAGTQALDAFLHEVVPQIEASAGYREGGLIAITFAASGDGTSGASAPSPAGATTPAIAYPAGTQVSTATATGTPGALLLSPFLARAGTRLTSTFNQLAPRKSIEELLRDPSKTAHQ